MPIVALLLALTIKSITPQTVNSVDDIITVSASASGLQSDVSQYLQGVLTKEGEATNYLGLTRNLNNEWYQYKSSPTASDLSDYFYSFTPVSGTWSGQLTVKVDVNDDGYKGPGNYILKLLKYISSSGTASINSATVTVNISVPTQTSTTTTSVATQTQNEITTIPTPVIEWSLPGQANLGEAFKVPVSFKNFEANKEYYLKLRGVRTKSGAAFLADNQAWVEFPAAAADGSGNWSGEVWGLVPEDKDPGTYEIRVRARRKDTDAYYESDAKGIKLVKVLIPVIATKSAVLGTESAKPKKTASKAAAPVETVKVDSSTDNMPKVLIALGVIFLAGSAVSYIINSKWRSATGPT